MPHQRPRRVLEEPPTESFGGPFVIANAGLVLLSPFLPRVFEQLGFLADLRDGRLYIAGADHQSRAVHLLQYLVDGRSDESENLFVLNKVLCGFAPAMPIASSIVLREQELGECDALIAAVLANWPAVKGTSPAGLRETFLQREGRLDSGSQGWRLTVQRKPVDVLVDQIPWALSPIFQRWMPEPLTVIW